MIEESKFQVFLQTNRFLHQSKTNLTQQQQQHMQQHFHSLFLLFILLFSIKITFSSTNSNFVFFIFYFRENQFLTKQ